MLRQRLPTAIVIAVLLALALPLAARQMGIALSRDMATWLLLGIIIIAYAAEALMRRGRKK